MGRNGLWEAKVDTDVLEIQTGQSGIGPSIRTGKESDKVVKWFDNQNHK